MNTMHAVRNTGILVLGLALVCQLLVPVSVARAQTEPGAPPLTAIGPDMGPMIVQNNHQIYNDSIVPDLPAQSRKADTADDGRLQEVAGRGVRHTDTADGQGLNLKASAPGTVCNDFNRLSQWASHADGADPMRDSYGGWGAFAVDDGGFHHARNVTVTLERTVGPGHTHGDGRLSAKISSSQPYAAGFGSPLLSVPPGAEVDVSVKYLIFDHDTNANDYDWVSLGLKPDATLPPASYVNGYTRGAWQTLTHHITAGETGRIMVLIQAESPSALNSNVYFDDIRIAVDGEFLTECLGD